MWSSVKGCLPPRGLDTFEFGGVARNVVVGEEEVRVGRVEEHDADLLVALDLGEQVQQLLHHHCVDQVNRRVVERDPPQRRCRLVQTEARVCHGSGALRWGVTHAFLL